MYQLLTALYRLLQCWVAVVCQTAGVVVYQLLTVLYRLLQCWAAVLCQTAGVVVYISY